MCVWHRQTPPHGACKHLGPIIQMECKTNAIQTYKHGDVQRERKRKDNANLIVGIMGGTLRAFGQGLDKWGALESQVCGWPGFKSCLCHSLTLFK